MKRILLFIFFLLYQHHFAQKRCSYSVDVSDSLGTLKTTKEYLMFEKVFGSNEQFIFFSLSNSNGMPFLTIQFVQKNNAFIPASCFEASTRVFFQLQNGKIVSGMHTNEEVCSTLLRDDTSNKDIRILSGNFLFDKESLQALKQSPINLMRIKFNAINTQDFIIKTSLESEFFKEFYRPESYFIEYLHCIEN